MYKIMDIFVLVLHCVNVGGNVKYGRRRREEVDTKKTNKLEFLGNQR